MAVGVLGLVGTGCSRGSYPVDIFEEMHYQQSYRIQEPDRLLPPEGAVAITGRDAPLPADIGAAASLANPLAADATTLAQGQRLFAVNCSICHGTDGRGDSVAATKFAEAQVLPPYDFTGNPAEGRITSGLVRTGTDGQLFWIISNGGFANMPAFKNLLTEEERWALVHYLRSLAQPVRQ
jgi:mono/diheme cytochrome c family protein